MKYFSSANLKQKNRAQRAVQNSNLNYTHVETPQSENDNNNDYKECTVWV